MSEKMKIKKGNRDKVEQTGNGKERIYGKIECDVNRGDREDAEEDET